MDGEERELLEKGVRHATASHTGEELDAALDAGRKYINSLDLGGEA